MKSTDVKVYAALVLAVAALGVAIHASMRVNHADRQLAAARSAAVDPQARDAVAQLRSALAQRDQTIQRLAARAAVAPSDPPAPASEAADRAPVRTIDPGPRFFERFEVSNAAVTVTQKPDGTYDIRTSDPALSGSVISVKAIAKDGAQEQLLVRVP